MRLASAAALLLPLLLLHPATALVPTSLRPSLRSHTRLRRSWFDDDLPNILVGSRRHMHCC